MKIKYLVLFWAMIFLTNNYPAVANQDTIAARSSVSELREDLNSLLENSELMNSMIGISIFSPEKGEFLFRHNDVKNFIPASTNKIFTTYTALELLGPDFTFTTRLYLDGEIAENGEFRGNIIIRGSGDPSLNKYFFQKPDSIFSAWADLLDSLNITTIRGNIIGDDSYFDNIPYGLGWAWDDMPFSYSPQISALSFYSNSVDLTISQGDTIGALSNYSVSPKNTYVRIINNIITSAPNDTEDIEFTREDKTNYIELFGKIHYDSVGITRENISLSIDNPNLFFLNIFREALEEKRIRFTGSLLDIDNWMEKAGYMNLEPVAEHVSPNLIEIINFINKESDNLGAELLLKTIGKEQTGHGSAAKGIEQVSKIAETAGINSEGYFICDGSGLSRMNLNSPVNFIKWLSYIYRSDYGNLFLRSLAKPGERGTLKRRMKKSLAERNVFAKTGTLTGVSCLTGYVKTRDNEIMAFSVMIQNFTAPLSVAYNLQDLICMRLASFTRNK
jgi:D-alanyl-D-alanine carboxypeptidase/D-alanyl-D-alanine-endopeptidase (penicillin-binding protein 4)